MAIGIATDSSYQLRIGGEGNKRNKFYSQIGLQFWDNYPPSAIISHNLFYVSSDSAIMSFYNNYNNNYANYVPHILNIDIQNKKIYGSAPAPLTTNTKKIEVYKSSHKNYSSIFGDVVGYLGTSSIDGSGNWALSINAPIDSTDHFTAISIGEDTNVINGQWYTSPFSYNLDCPKPLITLENNCNSSGSSSAYFSLINYITFSSYQWQKKNTNGTYTNISGATSKIYTPTGTTAGTYRIKINCGTTAKFSDDVTIE
jgi:hypothetical protein